MLAEKSAGRPSLGNGKTSTVEMTRQLWRMAGFDALWCPPGSPYRDADGVLRAIELDGHPFFVGTLFQPERAALDGATPPLVRALLVAAAARRRLSQTSGAATCC